MDTDGCVLAACRSVLDLLERDWQPLSTAELDQRLDQAVEDMLEADLIHKVKQTSEPPPRNDAAAAAASSSTGEEVSEEGRGDDEAVETVTALLRNAQSRSRVAGRARLSLSQTVPLCLSLLSSHVSYRTLSSLYRLEKGNIHRIFFFFCQCINTLQHDHIRWPLGDEVEAVLFPFSEERAAEGRRLPRVLGVLGHARIPIRMPSRKDSGEPEASKRPKKTEERPSSWLHLELACDRTGRFIHCRIGNSRDSDRGGALASRLQRESHLMPPDSVLVARAGYPLSARVLTPYPGRGGTRERRFNAALEPHFHILDRAVADLTGRFRRLRRLDVGNYKQARAVALSACVLHNVLMGVGHVPQGELQEFTSASKKTGCCLLLKEVLWVDAFVSAACELPPLNMSAACLALLSVLCLFCTTQTVEGNGVMWRPVGGSASIQCKLSEPLPITLVTLFKGREKDFPVVSKTAQHTTIAQNFRGRLRAEGDLLNIDVLIWNLTSEDTGLYRCVHEWFDDALSEHKVFDPHVPAALVVRDEQQCDNGNRNLLVGLVVVSAAVLFGVFVAFLLWSGPKIKKWRTNYRPRHTNDVYEDMRGTLRDERRPV